MDKWIRLAELFRITGDEQYRSAFINLWRSMRSGDRHNNGGFTSGEKAVGNPYDGRAIESCCTVAWSAMSVDMLDLTGDSRVADELEMTLFNSGLGMMSPSGRWVTYNTPMSGEKCASAHSIVFQARAGTPELNCCSVNGPRILGLISEWAVRSHLEGVAVNYYGPGRITTRTPGGGTLHLVQSTDYPLSGGISIEIGMDAAESFPLFLRIPGWSESTRIHLNGEPLARPVPGDYLGITRVWRTGDRIDLELDLTPHVWRKPGTVWNGTWNLFGPIARGPADTDVHRCAPLAVDPPLSAIMTIPEKLSVNGTSYARFTIGNGEETLDVRKIFPRTEGLPPSLIGMTILDAQDDTEVEVVYEADWWISWFVNGTQVSTGTGDGICSVPLRKGSNLIAFTLGGGSKRPGWLRLLRQPFVCESSPGPFKQVSIYRGPILLAYDPAFNETDSSEPPILSGASMDLQPIDWSRWLKPWMLFRCGTAAGGSVRLCDFASAGLAGGHRYASWLPINLDMGSTPLRLSPFALV